MSILVHINTDSESEIPTQETTDNGSSSTGELEPSELELIETRQFPSNREEATGSTITTLLLLDHTEENLFNTSDGSTDLEEMSEIKVLDASMSTETPTQTTDTLSGTSATMVLTKLGTSTEEESDIQSNHLLQVSNSKSETEWHSTEPSTELNISDPTDST